MRLRKVTRDDLTIARQKRGRGFCFRDADGRLVCDAAFKVRIGELAIPPAWRNVRVAPWANAHIQCVGTDEAGRVQYIYHPDWELRRSERKLRRLASLSAVVPRVRRRVRRDLAAEAGSIELAQAIAVALIDATGMRIGSQAYLRQNGTRGAATLFARDVKVSGKHIEIDFPAKGGKPAHYELANEPLAKALQRIMTLPGKRLLVHREGKKLVALRTRAINDYLRLISGVDISAKDFRTLRASALAAEALARIEPGASDSARKRQIAGVAREVSEMLLNTPAISRKSYIAPSLFKLFDSGRLQQLWSNATGRPEVRLHAILVAS